MYDVFIYCMMYEESKQNYGLHVLTLFNNSTLSH